jgi:hypothetical protein
MEKKDLPILTKGQMYVLFWHDGNISKCNFVKEENGFFVFTKNNLTIPVRLSSLSKVAKAAR